MAKYPKVIDSETIECESPAWIGDPSTNNGTIHLDEDKSSKISGT